MPSYFLIDFALIFLLRRGHLPSDAFGYNVLNGVKDSLRMAEHWLLTGPACEDSAFFRWVGGQMLIPDFKAKPNEGFFKTGRVSQPRVQTALLCSAICKKIVGRGRAEANARNYGELPTIMRYFYNLGNTV